MTALSCNGKDVTERILSGLCILNLCKSVKSVAE